MSQARFTPEECVLQSHRRRAAIALTIAFLAMVGAPLSPAAAAPNENASEQQCSNGKAFWKDGTGEAPGEGAKQQMSWCAGHTFVFTLRDGQPATGLLSDDRQTLTLCSAFFDEVARVALFKWDDSAPYPSFAYQVPQLPQPSGGCVTFTAPFTTIVDRWAPDVTFYSFEPGAWMADPRTADHKSINSGTFTLPG